MNQRLLNIEGVINFRDLGGYHTVDGYNLKWGQVFRSAQLDRMTEQGVRDMASLGIRTVVDLRFSDETSRYPTMVAAVPDAEILSWHDERELEQESDANARSEAMQRSWRDSLHSNDPEQVREAMRINYPKKLYSHRAIYRKMLLRLAEGATPLVFHCAAGKDRTGVAAALILSLLGVSRDQIVEDYLLTQPQIENLMDAWLTGGATGAAEQEDFQRGLARHSRPVVQPIFDADVNYITTLLDYVENTYQGFRHYAEQQLELTPQQLDALAHQLLE
ncbi:MAG: tyrosine-protein phosphatase [Arenicella sp.]|nr:tyrosine-protein phosphatase [Arenicella sp.]